MIQATTGRYGHRNAAINLTYGCDKDNNTYSYRMVNGSKVFQRVSMGPGWQNQKFTPNCEILKGDGEMGRAKAERPSDEVLREFAKAENYKGLVNAGKTRFSASYGTVKGWLIEAGIINEFGTVIAQAQTPPEDYGKCVICNTELKSLAEYCGTPEGNTCEKCFNNEIVLCANCQEEMKLSDSERYFNEAGERVCFYCALDQAQTEPGGDQPDPAQNEGQSADNNITCDTCGRQIGVDEVPFYDTKTGLTQCIDCSGKQEITVKDVLMYEFEQKEDEREHNADKFPPNGLKLFNTAPPLDSNESREDVPQRVNDKIPILRDNGGNEEEKENEWKQAQAIDFTLIEPYPLTEEMLKEVEADNRKEAERLAKSESNRRYCEQQDVSHLLQDWVIDVFKHHALSREKKLELIGELLDWGQEQ